jgi:NAD(P)H-dependent FMN reductase
MRCERGARAARAGKPTETQRQNARRLTAKRVLCRGYRCCMVRRMADDRFRLLGVSGSLREKSRTALALRLLLDFAEEHGAETRMLDLRAIELPLYRPDGPGGSAAELRLGADMKWASGVVLASPDYHGSMSGTMKNFLDYNWEECAGKVFGYICSSHEKGLTVMDQLRTVVRQCYGWSMPYGVSFDGRADFDSEGKLKHEKVEARLRMMARDLVVYGALIHRQFLSDVAGSDARTFAAAYR